MRAKGVIVGLLLVWAWLSHAQLAVWQTETALWMHAIQVTPQKPRPWLNLGVVLVSTDPPRAAQTLEHAVVLARQPMRGAGERAITEQAARVNLAYLASTHGDFTVAYALLSDAVKVKPDDPRVHFNLAYFWALQDRCGEARAELALVHRQWPSAGFANACTEQP